jgi:hypothetical protein
MTMVDHVADAEDVPDSKHALEPAEQTASFGLTRLGSAPSLKRSLFGVWGAFAPLLVAGVLIVGCTAAGAVSSGIASGTPSVIPTTQGSTAKVVIETGSVIDGFTLGARSECSGFVGSVPPDVIGCGSYPELAVAALDARDKGHAAIVGTVMFTDATGPGAIDVTGDASPSIPKSAGSGGVVTVFVFTLADGSIHATGVKCSESGPCVGVDGATGQ